MADSMVNKQHLGEYLESNCERQLFLHLGRGRKSWIRPFREIKTLERQRVANMLIKLGKEYEDEVYTELIKNNHNRAILNPHWKKKEFKQMLSAEYLNNVYKKLSKEGISKDLCLMEYDFDTPIELIRDLFHLEPKEEIPTDYSESLRPDLLIFGNEKVRPEGLTVLKVNKLQEPIGELMLDGSVREVPEEELEKRVGISIIDVKLSRKEKVGKKYFFEILFYCLALVRYLELLGLRDKFFVRTDNNGVFPRYTDLKGLKICEVRKKMVRMPFRDTYILYESISEQLKRFHEKIPCKIEGIPLNLQSICARCPYLEDCKHTLNFKEEIDPKSWDLRLLPYTSRTISEQLRDSISPQYETIEDVANKIQNHPTDNVPTPLFAEKPFLELRAKSLLMKKPISPEEGKSFSLTLPKYNDISLTIDLETDAIHDVVCSAAFYLEVFISQNSLYYHNFNDWWSIWDEFISDQKDLDNIVVEIMNNFDLREDRADINPESFLHEFGIALKYLLEERRGNKRPWISLDKKAKKSDFTYSRLCLEFALVNKGFTEVDENNFSEHFLNLLYSLVVFIQNLEWFLPVDNKYITSAIFYWSQEQIDYLEELLERNLGFLTEDPTLRKRTLYVLRWFNPSESDVKHPHHYKKFFDLRSFAETMMSFPLIINYTWHGLAKYLSRQKEYRKYFGFKEQNFYEIFWNPHFNYIDFQQWYRYLDKKGEEKKDLLEEILYQMITKVRTLNKLKQIFQEKGRTQLLGHNKPKPMKDFYEFDLPETYHNLCQIWFMYENYTRAYEEFEIDRIRNLYPSFGVGKLESAKIEKITQIPTVIDKRIYFLYEFKLENISANVKISDGEWVILIPEMLRDMPRYKNYLWKVVIEEMVWEDDHYEVSTRPWGNSLLDNFIAELYSSLQYTDKETVKNEISREITHLEKKRKIMDEEKAPVEINKTFYLYQGASNPWVSKLEKLLALSNFGESWLGEILAYKWGLTHKPSLTYPREFPYKGWLPEVYMYAPKLLPSYGERPNKILTKINPTPDDSQKNALLNAMKYTVYGIQGPPGTGKTQTIAALIDEFILQNKKEEPLKILVMAFSYAALRVVFENVIESSNTDGNPTEARKSKLVYLRSKDREIPTHKNTFYDLCKKKHFEVREMPSNELIGEISKDSKEKLEDFLDLDDENLILFGNAHQLYYLNERYYGTPKYTRIDFSFDLIVVDETSQVPVNYLLAGLLNVKNQRVLVSSANPNIKAGDKIRSPDEIRSENLLLLNKQEVPLNPRNLTKLILVGDQNQLPPVQQVKPPKKLKPILDNLFGYYCDYHGVENDQLQVNYRSHQKIVDHTNFLEIYNEEIQPKTNKDKKITGDLKRIKAWNKKYTRSPISLWVMDILNPDIPIGSLIHRNKYETAVSPFEASIVSEIVFAYYIMYMPISSKSSLEELQAAQKRFWNQKLGVVAPHNAQGRLIIREIFQKLIEHDINYLTNGELMDLLKKTVYSVERFQGSARDMIIASIGISAEDQLLSEEEFIYDLNRFNVLSSRARAKFIFISSEKFLTYIPQEQEAMINASKIRRFVLNFCNVSKELKIPFESSQEKKIQFRYRSP